MRSSFRLHLGLLLVFLLVFAAGLGLSTSFRGAAQAANPHVWLSQKVAPPTASMQVHGNGFGHSETVTVDFDMTLIGTATTDVTGTFALRITVPKSALPGMHTVRATGQSSGLTALETFLVQTDWAQFRFGPYHTGYNPYENVLTSSNVSSLTLDWTHTTGGRIFNSSPAVANGIVYVGAEDGKLHALDAVTGTLKWSYATGGLFSSPAVVNGVVYVGAGGALYALDAVTGTLKWSSTAGVGPYSSPAVANGVVYNDSYSGLDALDAVTGTLKWSYTANTRYVLDSSPAVANGVVYVGADKLYALDAVTGTLKWTYSTGRFINSSPAVVNGVVYVGSNDKKLYALDATTGALKWSYTTGGLVSTSPAVANGVVYVGSDKLYALDAATGALKWSTAVPPSDPAVANGVVYVDSGSALYALDAATGTLKWSYTTGGLFSSTPAVANGVVYVGSRDRNVYAFHLPGMSP